MNYPHDTRRVAGVLVPLSGLRTAQSAGCGEFADLAALGTWCAQTGQKLIQLLPVNDTGGQSSPYSALSAFALHPVYIRVSDLPEYQSLTGAPRTTVDAALATLRTEQEPRARFDYDAVLDLKIHALRTIWDAVAESVLADKPLASFTRANGWVRPYAVFRMLKDRNERRPWTEWDPEYRDATPDEVEKMWKRASFRHETRFHAWLQMRAAEQFAAAADALTSAGIALKGDIPILMNEDSVDAWYDRDIFRPELRAGAPPDMFSVLGQNWGFPIYNWERLAERDYDWWRARLRQAARFYHAYRIDHVLGFFRIWAIPAGNYSGIPGFFWPQHGITTEELNENGFNEGRIRWLSEPHITGDLVREALGDRVGSVLGPVLQQLPGEDLFVFAPAISGENDLTALDIAEDDREWLLTQWRDRALIPLPDGTWTAAWTFRECSRYATLSEPEKERLEDVIAARGAASNELWADHGRRILSVMKESTEMLPCAEDLGVVPEAVPRVLSTLGILGLKIPRWEHRWDEPGTPAVPFHEYPELSVCAPSVHDTSTMRGWWEQEDGRELLWNALALDGPCPSGFDPAVAREVYRAVLKSGSRIVVFQLQDLLALAPEVVHDDPAQERINIPGTYNTFNWTWRMPISLEDLTAHAGLNAEVSALMQVRP